MDIDISEYRHGALSQKKPKCVVRSLADKKKSPLPPEVVT